MSKANPHLPPGIIEQIDAQIAHYKGLIENLELTRKRLLEQPPSKVHFIAHNPKVSKDFVRTFLRQIRKPVRTVDIVEMSFSGLSDEERTKTIKTLSVVLNTLEKDGKIKVEKKPGVKGNFYTWIK